MPVRPAARRLVNLVEITGVKRRRCLRVNDQVVEAGAWQERVSPGRATVGALHHSVGADGVERCAVGRVNDQLGHEKLTVRVGIEPACAAIGAFRQHRLGQQSERLVNCRTRHRNYQDAAEIKRVVCFRINDQ